MSPSNLPKDYEPKLRKPFNPKPFEPPQYRPPLEYDESDEDDFVGGGMGHNFWLGVCNGVAIILVIGICSFALWQLGTAAYHILTQ